MSGGFESSENPPARWRTVAVLAPSMLLAKTLWFSASAVIPQFTEEKDLRGLEPSLLTVSVQLGFVAGALFIALTNLADRWRAPRLMGISALLGGLFNGCLVVWQDQFAALIGFRFLTGAALAGVYPPGMKLLSTWFVRGRGFALGILIASLTFGAATPHLFNAIVASGGAALPNWERVVLFSSVAALFGGVSCFCFLREGPFVRAPSRFDWKYAGKIFTERGLRLANFGYLGHQWELYAMWAWVPLLVRASYLESGWTERAASWAGFAVIGVGALGSLIAGVSGDRFGRCRTASASLALSGLCCLGVGFFFESPVVLTGVCLFWGFVVVADSAQFSTAVSELSDPRTVGTALTMQTCSGFFLTALTIGLMPVVIDFLGWKGAFSILCLGPIFGLVSMIRLRALPEAKKMAHGHR